MQLEFRCHVLCLWVGWGSGQCWEHFGCSSSGSEVSQVTAVAALCCRSRSDGDHSVSLHGWRVSGWSQQFLHVSVHSGTSALRGRKHGSRCGPVRGWWTRCCMWSTRAWTLPTTTARSVSWPPTLRWQVTATASRLAFRRSLKSWSLELLSRPKDQSL